jgi:NMD protein affecting ribosome stability and mRNA decay
MVKVMDAPSSRPPSATASSCKVCRKSADTLAVGLRRGLCRACYLREWRGTALPDGAACAICDERRRIVLRWTRLADRRVVTCQNCGFVADKARPRPRTVDELRERMLRERRRSRERRRNYVVEPSDPAERRQRLRRRGRARA